MGDLVFHAFGAWLGLYLGWLYFHLKDEAEEKKQKSIRRAKARAYQAGKQWWVVDRIGDD